MIVVALVASVGCGDSSSAGSGDLASGASPDRKAKFLEVANAKCRRLTAGVDKRLAAFVAEQRKEGKSGPEANATAVHYVLLPAIETQAGALYNLPAPSGEESRIGAMLTAERTAIDRLALMDRIDSIKAAEEAFNPSAKLFNAYGLVECANGK